MLPVIRAHEINIKVAMNVYFISLQDPIFQVSL